MLFIMRATQILLRYNYHMITACEMVIFMHESLDRKHGCPLETSSWHWASCFGNQYRPPPPKLCCQRTNEPIWLLVRQKGRFVGLRGLDEPLQFCRHLYLLVSPVEPEVHTGMVWWSGGGESAVVVWEPLLGESLRSSQYPVHGGAVGGGQGQHRRPFCVCFGLSSPPHPHLSQLLTLDHQSVCSKALSDIRRWEIGRGKRWRRC